MPRKESEAVPEGNGPTPQDTGKMVTWEELRQAVSKMWDEVLRDYKEGLRSLDQRLAGQEQDARQSRLAMGGRQVIRHKDSRAHGGRC